MLYEVHNSLFLVKIVFPIARMKQNDILIYCGLLVLSQNNLKKV